jgi:hypothetical protein
MGYMALLFKMVENQKCLTTFHESPISNFNKTWEGLWDTKKILFMVINKLHFIWAENWNCLITFSESLLY